MLKEINIKIRPDNAEKLNRLAMELNTSKQNLVNIFIEQIEYEKFKKIYKDFIFKKK